ncbi:MAG: hypothetical protein PHV78_03605, partial [Patescibacteria group bacterium]|nr:hypothetical protein [Patescibacteria group bacterium]
PIIVIVKVPNDASFGDYKGNIRIKTSPINPDKGKVNIALGAQLEMWELMIQKRIGRLNYG